MFRGLIDILNPLLWCYFIYAGSFLLMIVTLVYVIQTTTPIEKHFTTVQVREPSKGILVGRKIRTRIDASKVVPETCPTCVVVKV